MKQFSLAAAAAAVSILFASPACAQTYVGLSAGLSLNKDLKNTGATTAVVPVAGTLPAIANGTALAWETKADEGLDLSLQIGHRFAGGFRVEAEMNYNKVTIDRHQNMTIGTANVDAQSSNVLTRQTTTAPTVGTVLNSGTGGVENYSAFLNGIYDFNSEGSFMPYIGAGAGVMRTKLDYRPSGLDIGQGTKTNFAWQLLAGATYKIGKHVEVFGQYSYRDGGYARMNLDILPASVKARTAQSTFSLGVRFPFGGQ